MSNLPLVVLAPPLYRYGLGKDIWDADIPHLDNLFRDLYIASLFYQLTSGFVKIGILAFYLRIFPNDIFKRVAWALIVLSATWAIAFTFVWAFSCIPVSYSWTRWNTTATGKCVNIPFVVLFQAALNLTLEVAIFLLPIPVLLKLRMNWKKKAQVSDDLL